MAGDSNERSAQAIRHMLHEPAFPAPRRPFKHDRHPGKRGRFEEADLTVGLGVERLLLQPVLLDPLLYALGHYSVNRLMMIIIERGAELTQATALMGMFSATENGEAFDDLKMCHVSLFQYVF